MGTLRQPSTTHSMVKFRDINSSPNAVLSLCTPHPIIWPPPSLADVSIPPLKMEKKNTSSYFSTGSPRPILALDPEESIT